MSAHPPDPPGRTESPQQSTGEGATATEVAEQPVIIEGGEQAADRSGPSGALALLIRGQSVFVLVAALVLAFAVGALLIRLQGVNPTFAYQFLFRTAFGSGDGLARTLEKTTPLILTGIAVAVPLRVGLFNIGAQGQFIAGAIGAAWIGYAARDLGLLALPLAIAVGVVFGAVWAGIAAVLKVTRGVHEVIATIMLNSIAIALADWLINNPLKAPGAIPRTNVVGEGAMIGRVGPIPLGFVLAVLLAVAMWLMLKVTTTGFRFDTVGKNRFAAGYAGISYTKVVLLSMGLAGLMGGLAGATEVLGVTHRYEMAFAASLGFDGITIALLARSNPLGTIPAALLLGAMRAGAPALQFQTGITQEIVDLLLAITLLFVSIPILAKLLYGRYARKGAALASSWGN